jgi:hypothetical protein
MTLHWVNIANTSSHPPNVENYSVVTKEKLEKLLHYEAQVRPAYVSY